MKSLTPAQKYDFSTPSVIEALNTASPSIWRKGSAKVRMALDSEKILDIVRKHELNLVWEFEYLEPEENEEGYIETEYVCPVDSYQFYVQECVINYYS